MKSFCELESYFIHHACFPIPLCLKDLEFCIHNVILVINNEKWKGFLEFPVIIYMMDANKSSVSKNNSYSCFLIFCSIRNLD